MSNELIAPENLGLQVGQGFIKFSNYEKIMNEAVDFLADIKTVSVSTDNISQSKKGVAEIRKRFNLLEDERKAIKKAMLEPYLTFEIQVKEIGKVITEADNFVRNQIRALEEIERNDKKTSVEALFKVRIEQYDFKDLFTFDDFLKPQHLNKTVSINKVEEELVDWLTAIENDLTAIQALPNSVEVLVEYKQTKSLSASIQIVNCRYERAKKAQTAVQNTPFESVKTVASFELYATADVDKVEAFMNKQNIKYIRK